MMRTCSRTVIRTQKPTNVGPLSRTLAPNRQRGIGDPLIRGATMAHMRSRKHAVVFAIFTVMSVLLGGCAAHTIHAGETTGTTPSVHMPHAVPFVGVQDVFGRNAL